MNKDSTKAIIKKQSINEIEQSEQTTVHRPSISNRQSRSYLESPALIPHAIYKNSNALNSPFYSKTPETKKNSIKITDYHKVEQKVRAL